MALHSSAGSYLLVLVALSCSGTSAFLKPENQASDRVAKVCFRLQFTQNLPTCSTQAEPRSGPCTLCGTSPSLGAVLSVRTYIHAPLLTVSCFTSMLPFLLSKIFVSACIQCWTVFVFCETFCMSGIDFSILAVVANYRKFLFFGVHVALSLPN